MKKFVLAFLALAVPPLIAQSGTFSPRDLFALRQASDAEISPDGKRVLYVRQSENIQTDSADESIWMVDVSTGAEERFVAGPASNPRWSHDGSRVAYLAPDAAGKSQIYVRTLTSPTPTHITDAPHGPGNLAWSPDDRSIAFTMFVPEPADALPFAALTPPAGATWAKPPRIITSVHYRSDGGGYLPVRHTHLFLIPAAGGSARQLTSGAYNEGGLAAWTPDGRFLIFSSNHNADRDLKPHQTQLFELRLEDGAEVQLTHRFGANREPVVSPDGKLIAYTGFDDHLLDYETTGLYVMARDGSGPHLLSASLDRDVFTPRWAPDGRGLYVESDEHGDSRVLRFTLDGRWSPFATGLDGDTSFTLANDGTLAYPVGGADHPPDLAVTLAGAQVRRLTRLNAGLLDGKTLGLVTPLAVKSSFDGLPVGAWAVTPPHYDPARRYPTILSIHGGPYGSYGPLWSSDFQLYAAAGYVVVYANPRGSTSYGFSFSDGIRHDFPGHSFDDLMSVVDAAVAKGLADPDRLYVTGGSAGGELTAWIVGRTDRFRAAVAVKPVINIASEELTTDQYGYTYGLFGKMPWEMPDVFWAHSPLSLVGHVKTPTLLMVGDEDHRTPPSEAEQFYDALQLRNVPTALVLVPGASHESLTERPSQHAAENAIVLAWFGRYGGGEGK